MALFTHTYSGLITGGLGLPACCGLITMGFHVFKCTIEVIIPPGKAGGGGGGSFAAHPEIYVPYVPKQDKCVKQVQITVKFKDTKTWRKSFTIDTCNADKLVRVIDIVNTIKDKMYVGVDSFKKASRRVAAVFKTKDK